MTPPNTVEELIVLFEQRFCCLQGPARGFFEVPVGKDGEHHRWVYDQYVFVTDREEGHERELVRALWADFEPIADKLEGTLLVWRLAGKIVKAYEKERVLGAPRATAEAVEDGLVKLPEGKYAQDFAGNWCVDLGYREEWKLRTRLVIPALMWVGEQFTMRSRLAEGALPVRIV